LIELHQIAAFYALSNGRENQFDAVLKALYGLYFRDHYIMNVRTKKTQMFIQLVTLVKIMEQKFFGTRMPQVIANLMKNEQAIMMETERKWRTFKDQKMANPANSAENVAGMRELLAKIFSILMEIQTMPIEIAA
jgi:hypothetical protein